MLLNSLNYLLIFLQVNNFHLQVLNLDLDLGLVLKLSLNLAHNSSLAMTHIASQIIDKFFDVSIVDIFPVLLFIVLVFIKKHLRLSINRLPC